MKLSNITEQSSFYKKMNIMRLLIALLFLSLNVAVYAQTASITGKVFHGTNPVADAKVEIFGKNNSTHKTIITDLTGIYLFEELRAGAYLIKITHPEFKTTSTITLKEGEQQELDFAFAIEMPADSVVYAEPTPEPEPEPLMSMEEAEKHVIIAESAIVHRDMLYVEARAGAKMAREVERKRSSVMMPVNPIDGDPVDNTESYKGEVENPWVKTKDEDQSTFSIDVDRASYSNIRRHLNNGGLPPVDAVRIEEMVNYFNYDYPKPKGKHPFHVDLEMAEGFWNKETKLLRIGLKGQPMDLEDAPNSNLVFLLDVSGSMNSANKLPLVKGALGLLVNNMRDEDRVSIVVYAGAAGLVLPPTPGTDKNKILEAINNLSAGGSTAGGAGIQLAYKTAQDAFIKGGNNRVILATDGDFNVGASSAQDLENLIVEKREEGVFLTVLGVGMGNYKDDRLETLADKGNGNYAYLDNMKEANKVLVEEIGGTLFTIAKDVKLQLDFNEKAVKSYRLIGYENRMLENQDFNDDTKDAGELGAGHTVTALYEIIPAKGANSQKEWVNVKLRYKKPDGDKSILMEVPFNGKSSTLEKASVDFKFATATAGWGMLLRESKYIEDLSFDEVLKLAKAGKGVDKHGYRKEMIQLVELSKSLKETGK